MTRGGSHAQDHTKEASSSMGQKSRGLEKPIQQQVPLGAVRLGTSKKAVPGGLAAIHPGMMDSLKPDSYSSTENIAF